MAVRIRGARQIRRAKIAGGVFALFALIYVLGSIEANKPPKLEIRARICVGPPENPQKNCKHRGTVNATVGGAFALRYGERGTQGAIRSKAGTGWKLGERFAIEWEEHGDSWEKGSYGQRYHRSGEGWGMCTAEGQFRCRGEGFDGRLLWAIGWR